MLATRTDFNDLMKFATDGEKLAWLNKMINQISNPFFRELARAYEAGILGESQKKNEILCDISKAASGRYQFFELVKCAVSHPVQLELLVHLAEVFCNSPLASNQEAILAFHSIATVTTFQNFDAETYSRFTELLINSHGQTKLMKARLNLQTSRLMLTTSKKQAAEQTDQISPLRYQDIYFYYSSSHVMGFHISSNCIDRTSHGLKGSTASISNIRLLDQIPIDYTVYDRRKDADILLCFDLFTTGNMYHSTIGHLLAALIHDGLHESKIVNCFSPLTWVWTRKLIAQIFPRDKVDYGLVPDKRCFIKNAILYDIPPLSLLNDPLHREKVLCAVSRLRNAAIALSQRANIINHPKRIFISRHSSAARSPSNLTDLEFLMKEFDFQILYFEHISPEEQLCYFHHAEIIAGLHGAALTNIIAARTNATLLEFSLTYEKRRCYENLAKKILCINYLESSCISKVRQDGKEIHLINLEVAQESLLQAIAQSCR